jgi:hypothetical protein
MQQLVHVVANVRIRNNMLVSRLGRKTKLDQHEFSHL